MKEKNIRINSTVLHRVDSLRRVKLWSFVSYSFLRRKFISPLAQYASQHRNAFQRMVSKVTTPICNVHWANVGIQAGRLSCTFAIATITPSTLCSAAILWTHIFDATKAIHNNDVQGIAAAVVACYLSRWYNFAGCWENCKRCRRRRRRRRQRRKKRENSIINSCYLWCRRIMAASAPYVFHFHSLTLSHIRLLSLPDSINKIQCSRQHKIQFSSIYFSGSHFSVKFTTLLSLSVSLRWEREREKATAATSAATTSHSNLPTNRTNGFGRRHAVEKQWQQHQK